MTSSAADSFPPLRIFLAGASGVIGRRLVPLVRAAGMTVVGTTRSSEKAAALKALGVEPVILDAYDEVGVRRAVAAARPHVVIHQLTDLPQVFDPALMQAARARNARLRETATPILMRAAQAAGANRAIVQSICFVYAAGKRPHEESDPIDSPSVQTLENVTLNTPGVAGLVLRYGRLWGPGTWTDRPKEDAPVHVDAAAQAAFQAITRGVAGIYNIAENDGAVSIAKAQRELGFDPSFRLSNNVGAASRPTSDRPIEEKSSQ